MKKITLIVSAFAFAPTAVLVDSNLRSGLGGALSGATGAVLRRQLST